MGRKLLGVEVACPALEPQHKKISIFFNLIFGFLNRFKKWKKKNTQSQKMEEPRTERLTNDDFRKLVASGAKCKDFPWKNCKTLLI